MKRLLGLILLGTSLLVSLPALAETAVPAAGSDEILSKLSELEKKQEAILAELEQIKAEIQIVKVRVSLKN